MNMTTNVIQGVRFRKVEASSPTDEILRDIMVDVEQDPDPKNVEIYAFVRYTDGTYDVWASNSINLFARIGEIEAIKQHLLTDIPTDGRD